MNAKLRTIAWKFGLGSIRLCFRLLTYFFVKMQEKLFHSWITLNKDTFHNIDHFDVNVAEGYTGYRKICLNCYLLR